MTEQTNQPAMCPDPFGTPGLLRILLGATASEALAAAGDTFVLQAYRSALPEHAGRFILLALPVSKDVADACARVVKGTHCAVVIRRPNTHHKVLQEKY